MAKGAVCKTVDRGFDSLRRLTKEICMSAGRGIGIALIIYGVIAVAIIIGGWELAVYLFKHIGLVWH